MATTALGTDGDLYEADFAAWADRQAALLREGRLGELDREHLIEEIESLGRSERREIMSRMIVLVMHLLKLARQPEAASQSWRASVFEQRRRLARLLRDSPSLKGYPAELLQDCHAIAREKAAAETGLPVESFPERCPFSADQALDEGWWPGDLR